MANPMLIAELIRVATTRQLAPDEIESALAWLREAEREEVSGALLRLAEN